MITLTTLLDDAKCYEVLRELHWPEGVTCPHCGSAQVSRQGRDTTQPARQKYRCGDCGRHFDDLTGTIFAGRHQSLVVWIGCMYLMGLNLSNRQIAHELGLNEDDMQRMTEQLRTGIVASEPPPCLSGEVECDELYVVAGHKGHPDAVKKKGVPGGAVD
jgi:transposase-like protein